MVASHTTAAVRTARSLVIPAPTPVATAQIRASAHEDRRSAGTGGDSLRTLFHVVVNSLCVASPAKVPQQTDKSFQPNVFPSRLPTIEPMSSSTLTATNRKPDEPQNKEYRCSNPQQMNCEACPEEDQHQQQCQNQNHRTTSLAKEPKSFMSIRPRLSMSNLLLHTYPWPANANEPGSKMRDCCFVLLKESERALRVCLEPRSLNDGEFSVFVAR